MLNLEHEYHIVECNNVQPPKEVFDWLNSNCGDGSDGRWGFKHPNIYFADKRDHMMFVLRFSSTRIQL
jgi:hypothetical protein